MEENSRCNTHPFNRKRPDLWTTVIGVYLPCADLGTETYCEHLIELERIISDNQRLGPVVIMGDFNAHLGALGGERGVDDPNQQGLLLHQLLTRCNLYVVSLSLLATGPQYTFQNSVTQTTVDYILASQDAFHYIQQCFTHMPAALNYSDHLPITMMLRPSSCHHWDSRSTAQEESQLV